MDWLGVDVSLGARYSDMFGRVLQEWGSKLRQNAGPATPPPSTWAPQNQRAYPNEVQPPSLGVVALECPSCGGHVDAPAGAKSAYCQYCGSQVLVDDGSRVYSYHNVDEARMHEADLQAQLELKRLEVEEKHRVMRMKLALVMLIIGTALFVLGAAFQPLLSMAGMLLLSLAAALALPSSKDGKGEET